MQIHVSTHLSKPIKHTPPRMNPEVNCGLQVCLSSGNHNKIPQTGWVKQHLFLTVLEARKSKIKLQTWYLVRALFLPCSGLLSHREGT